MYHILERNITLEKITKVRIVIAHFNLLGQNNNFIITSESSIIHCRNKQQKFYLIKVFKKKSYF